MKDDLSLRQLLQEKIAIIKRNRNMQRAVEDEMANLFNVKYDRTVDIFNGNELIESTPYHMLYKLMVSIANVMGTKYAGVMDLSGLYAEKYFTDIEIKEYALPLKENSSDFKIVIKDFRETNVGNYSYITIYTDIDEVMKWADHNRLRFNPETQRDLITIETNGIPIKKFDLNEKSVNAMKEAMLKGTYFPVPGALNINPELYDEYPIILNGGNLIIPSHVHIDLVEGFHNYIAATQVKQENPDWKYPYEFRLYLLNKEGANRYIGQMDAKNHFSDAQAIRLTVKSEIKYFVTQLNASNDFFLNGTIDSEMTIYLYRILQNMFDIDKIKDAVFLLEDIKPNLNYIIKETSHFDSPFNNQEWYVYLRIIRECLQLKVDFRKVFDNLDLDNIFNNTINVNRVSYKANALILNAIKEAIEHV